MSLRLSVLDAQQASFSVLFDCDQPFRSMVKRGIRCSFDLRGKRITAYQGFRVVCWFVGGVYV